MLLAAYRYGMWGREGASGMQLGAAGEVNKGLGNIWDVQDASTNPTDLGKALVPGLAGQCYATNGLGRKYRSNAAGGSTTVKQWEKTKQKETYHNKCGFGGAGEVTVDRSG